LRIVKGILCEAVSNTGFVFDSWSNRAPQINSSTIPGNKALKQAFSTIIWSWVSRPVDNAENPFSVSRYSVYTANFLSIEPVIQAASPYLSVATLLLVILFASTTPTSEKRKSLLMKKRGERKQFEPEC
jgi:hypothetical protein